MEPVVHFRSAVALLGRFPALTGVNLDVGAGEIVLVTGPNGAGKTTLLRCCAGLLRVTAGTARVLGVDLVADRVAVRPMVGLLGHDSGLYDELSVIDNLRFWARAVGAPTDDIDAVMDRVGVASRLADVAVSRLSTGQRRRAGLAALVIRRPSLWLLDEPHAGLDQRARDELDALARSAARQGATVLFSSHELDRAEALATRSVHLVGGAVVCAESHAEQVS
ncbi:MAG: heme ABC exporter ATP-binding protein CcmA [Microthrixaceae bacterium]|nr:heme ABC exporter ATP-binding protein CcmA [Microthrixaceae bacterium]